MNLGKVGTLAVHHTIIIPQKESTSPSSQGSRILGGELKFEAACYPREEIHRPWVIII
jgi:hypothetical protein